MGVITDLSGTTRNFAQHMSSHVYDKEGKASEEEDPSMNSIIEKNTGYTVHRQLFTRSRTCSMVWYLSCRVTYIL
jgi:hypothetical protein